jgi:hypothetical protein
MKRVRPSACTTSIVIVSTGRLRSASVAWRPRLQRRRRLAHLTERGILERLRVRPSTALPQQREQQLQGVRVNHQVADVLVFCVHSPLQNQIKNVGKKSHQQAYPASVQEKPSVANAKRIKEGHLSPQAQMYQHEWRNPQKARYLSAQCTVP